MPNSSYIHLPFIFSKIDSFTPQSILDFSTPLGKYGLLLRELMAEYTPTCQLDALSTDSSTTPNLGDIYDTLYIGTTTQQLASLPSYDVILMDHQLELFDYDTGEQFLSTLLTHCHKALIIVTPTDTPHTPWSLPYLAHFDYDYHHKDNLHIFILHPVPTTKYEDDLATLSQLQYAYKPLVIAYLLPHRYLTGGLKMLLQQMALLKKRGHTVYAVLKTDAPITRVIPDWIDMAVDREIIVPPSGNYMDYLTDCDIIVAGWIYQVAELLPFNRPVLYWEQGNEGLFGESNTQHTSEAIRSYLHYCYNLPVQLLSVSHYVAQVLSSRFKHDSLVLSNGIDTSFYHPGTKSEVPTILLVGNPILAFKGFDIAFKALEMVSKFTNIPFKVKWACQEMPPETPHSFPLEIVLHASQEQLATEYREATMLLFTSWYEGFGMPPLEAMASGTAVVCTRCGGVEDYTAHTVNGLLAPPGDVKCLASYIGLLLQDNVLRHRLEVNGLTTALSYDYTHVIARLEQHLYHTIALYNQAHS